MPLNKKGIRLLAADLVALKKRYNQNTFGDRESECGTVCCLAGFCYAAEIGSRKFNQLIKGWNYSILEKNCLKAGKNQLGIRARNPQIFDDICSWPQDLREEYYTNGPRGRVIVALKGLQRLKPTGKIDDNPEAVHTKIPILDRLLQQQKKAA